MMLSSVVLPQPEGPRTETNSLSLKLMLTPRSAWTLISPAR